MLDKNDVLSTVQMIDRQHLDIRTITMGISLLSCADRDAKAACEKIYDKITRYAEGLVKTGEDIEREFGIPIVNKRISSRPSRSWPPPRRRRTTFPLPSRSTAPPRPWASISSAAFPRSCKRA